jgi:hypothetical protein
MSLKAFHVAFISVCILLCWGLTAWWFWQWRTGTADGGIYYGIAWFLAGIGLLEYGRRALRKMKRISYL